jgi:hypothetical protein
LLFAGTFISQLNAQTGVKRAPFDSFASIGLAVCAFRRPFLDARWRAKDSRAKNKIKVRAMSLALTGKFEPAITLEETPSQSYLVFYMTALRGARPRRRVTSSRG